MYTIAEFTSEWKRLHHPSMNVDGDMAFFYEIYVRLHRLLEQEAAAFLAALYGEHRFYRA